MEIGILLCVIVLVLVAVNWDGDRLARRAEEAAGAAGKRRGIRPRARATWGSLAVASVSCVVLAVGLLFYPPRPPFTGRGSWLWSPVYALLGTYAAAQVAIAIALLLAAGAVAIRSRVGKSE
jgi:hypothetical protein